MTWVALPWFVVTTTGSATKMAIVVAVEAAALGIVGFAAGNLVGRVGLRRTMLVADACRAPLIAAVPLLYAAGLLSFPLLLVLVFAVGAFGTPSFVSKAAILPEIVGEDEGVLGEANALLQAAMRIALVLGPVLAGVLIGVVGATNVLYIDAATFLVAFVLIACFVKVGGAAPETEESRGLGAGVRFSAQGPAPPPVVDCDRGRRRRVAGVFRRYAVPRHHTVRGAARDSRLDPRRMGPWCRRGQRCDVSCRAPGGRTAGRQHRRAGDDRA